MPRIRTIKPDYFTDEEIAELPALTRLAFIGLWCHADREGRLEDRPRRLKALILPHDECDFEAILDELDRRKFIHRYNSDGAFIQIRSFVKHQRPHHTEKPSDIPAFSSRKRRLKHGGATDSPPSTGDMEKGKENGEGKGNESPPTPPEPAAPRPREIPRGDLFAEAFDAFPVRTPRHNRDDAAAAWTARMRAGVDPAAILAGVRRYAAYCEATGKVGGEFVKQASSFFGPRKHWEQGWEIPAAKGTGKRVYQLPSGRTVEIPAGLVGRIQWHEPTAGALERYETPDGKLHLVNGGRWLA